MTSEHASGDACHAVVLRGPGDPRLETIHRPAAGQGELLLDLRCCGLCGSDLFKILHQPPPEGTVLGHEVVGTVVEIGPGVEGFSLGDRVVTPHHVPCGSCHLCRAGNPTLCPVFREDLLSPGGFSESFVVLPRAVRQAARSIPSSMSDELAIFLEPTACVLRGIDRAGLPRPDRSSGSRQAVLIVGGGSMGLLHLLTLRALYPDLQIAVSDPLDHRREMADRLGADLTVGPHELGPGLADLTQGRGIDCVFDTVGHPAALRRALQTTREGATLVLFAHGRPGDELQVELNSLFKSERRLVGTYSGGPEEQERVWALLAEQRLDPTPLITHRLPLSRFAEGVDLATSHQALKVLFVPDREFDLAAP